MFPFQLVVLVLTSVSTLALPYNYDISDIAIRAPVVNPLPLQLNALVNKPLRRRSSGRCSANSPPSLSSSSSSSTSTSSAPTVPPAAVEAPPPSPPSSSSSSSAPPAPPAATTSVTLPPPPPPPPAPATSSAPAPAPAPSQPQSPPSSGTNSGQGTFYGTGLGACGVTNSDSDLIVAVSESLFDTYPGAGADPNTNPVCGKQITAFYQGKSVTVTVEDRCTGCALDDLDFSPTAFSQLANQDLGRIGITWEWS